VTTPIPSIPLFTSAVDGIFAKILASLQAKRLAAEAALPGSGKFFDQEIADVTAARAAVSPAALAQLLVTDMGSFIAGTAPIVHKGSDLAR
jgi:hypothetical protein